MYEKTPSNIQPQDLDQSEGRIIITNQFLSGKSAVKIFIFTTDNPDDETSYKKSLKLLVDQMMYDSHKTPEMIRAALKRYKDQSY